jgi:hypothetical protein
MNIGTFLLLADTDIDAQRRVAIASNDSGDQLTAARYVDFADRARFDQPPARLYELPGKALF